MALKMGHIATKAAVLLALVLAYAAVNVRTWRGAGLDGPGGTTTYQPASITTYPGSAHNQAASSADKLSQGLEPSEINGYEDELDKIREESSVLQRSWTIIEARLENLLSAARVSGTGAHNERREGSAPRKPQTGYTFWSSDFHISPIADLKDLLEPMGMHIIDKSLSGHCHLKKTCAKDLKVLTRDNGIDLGECPNKLRRQFFEAYKNDPTMARVDAFLCHHACGLCEVFMPFNKSLIVVASTRYEIGRHSPQRWAAWNENLKRIAANPRNVVAANNLYDAEYIKYFTGLKDVPVIPNFCGYTGVTYNPRRKEILVGPGRGVHEGLFRELQSAGMSRGVAFARIRDLYPHFEYSQLVEHPAIVLIPYQVSIMSIFEYYRMCIPMFAPSPALLARWQVKHRVMNERTWDGVYGHPGRKSALGPHPDADSALTKYDPNNEMDEQAIKHWVAFADFYQWPYIRTFESWSDLLDKMEQTNLKDSSQRMKAYNDEMQGELREQWRDIIGRIFGGQPPAAMSSRQQIMDYDESMAALYDVKVQGCVE